MSIAAQLAVVVQKDTATKFARAAVMMERRLDQKVPVDTGLLMRSQHASVSLGTVMVLVLSYPLDYGEYHDRGMPSVIRPKRRKFLRFEGDHGIVYAREVHPTQKHKGWFSRTVLEWPAILRTVFAG